MKSLLHWFRRSAVKSVPAKRRSSVSLAVEGLERREVPTVSMPLLNASVASAGVVRLEALAAASPITVGSNDDFATVGGVGSLGNGASITVKGITYTLQNDTVYRKNPNQANAVALSTGAPVKAFNVDANGAVYALQYNHQLEKFPIGTPQQYTQLDYNVDSFALDGRGAVYTLSKAGNLWKFPTSTPGQYQKLDYGVTSFAVDPRGPVYTLSTAGNLWKFATGTPGQQAQKLDYNVASFALDGHGAVYTLSQAGNLWKFATATPGQYQKLDYTSAPDGACWFLDGPADGQTARALYRLAGGQLVPQQGTYTALLGVASDAQVWVANQSRVYHGDGMHWTAASQATGLGLLDSASFGQSVVGFAQQHLGQMVTTPENKGTPGECTDLVIAALRAAGNRTTYDYGVNGPDKDYVWGRLVRSVSISVGPHSSAYEDTVVPTKDGGAMPVLAGDIIQFRNVQTTTKTGPNTLTMNTISHHVAIIEKVLGNGMYKILEQNWDNGNADGRVVRESIINLASMTPDPNPKLKDSHGVSTGTYWIYRPVSK